MVNFTISAPGKVILYGEHAVVYGKRALAASLGLRTYLTLYTTKTDDAFGELKLNFESINLKRSYNFTQITPLLLNPTTSAPPSHLTDAQFTSQLALLHMFLSADTNITPAAQNGLLSFLFLLTCILTAADLAKQVTLTVDVTTELTVGAGLGSSASFSVCVAAAMICCNRAVKGNDFEFTQGDLRHFSDWAFNAERIIHGTPSGVDNTICTYGALVEFRKGSPPMPVAFPNESATYKLKILLVNTNVPKDTKKMVAGVAELNKKIPDILGPILESIDKITESASNEFKVLAQCVKNDESNLTASENIKNSTCKLERLSAINQHLLSALGVSHPALDRVCSILAAHDISAKLTGAGGGGYAIALVPAPRYTADVIAAAVAELVGAGYEGRVLQLGGWGVRIKVHDKAG